MPRRKTSRQATAASKHKGSDTDTNWETKTVVVLRDFCRKRGLDSSGTKGTLVQRLNENELKSESEEDKPTPAKLPKKGAAVDKMAEVIDDGQTSEEPHKKRHPKPDEQCPLAHCVQVLEDYDCMLNQTNINANNNKFYTIQLLKTRTKDEFHVWTRWGRVGETGQSQLGRPLKKCDDAVKEFEKKFNDKTRNNWTDRANFVPRAGKYTLLEMDDDDDDESTKQDDETKKKPCVFKNEVYTACLLDQPTKELVSLLFDDNMFVNSMAAMDLDVKKMPLGKLSKTQISKGFDALLTIEDAIKAKNFKDLERLTNVFFTQIPHSFGRQRPPVLDSLYLVQKKKDMLLVLSDIELAQALQKKNVDAKDVDVETLKPHPIDEKYGLLQCGLSLLKRPSKEHKVIETYVEHTQNSNWKIRHIWKVDRGGEGERFKEHDAIKNRKLLWHGTNVAVVAAILNSGLRIMPHSGGRVGRGIYFASEHAKSALFVQFAANRVGIMFLAEVALGREKTITVDDCSLTQAPKGFDSIIARGTREPDPKKDTTIQLDDKDVIVPQGPPIPSEHKHSSFHESEYLIYKESQARIRYLITF